tara:strand:+ start:4 stop:507 length:504 start_codon:yes stop_codon:yes gene_type:complete
MEACIKKTVEKLLNDQLTLEFEAAYSYLGMAAYFESIDYGGGAHWMKCQSKEEMHHFHKIFDFIFERDGLVNLSPVKKPNVKYKGVLDVFKTSLAQEKKVTASIHTIYDACLKQKAYASFNFLNWFIEEQVEEEAEVTRIIKEIERIHDNKSAMLILDRELGKRSED